MAWLIMRVESIEDALQAEENDHAAGDGESNAGVAQAALCTGAHKQPCKRDYHEKRDDHQEAPWGLDEEENHPAGGATVEPQLQAHKGEGGRARRQQEPRRVVPGGAISCDDQSEDRQPAEHDELRPEPKPGPVVPAPVLGRRFRIVHSASLFISPPLDYIETPRRTDNSEKPMPNPTNPRSIRPRRSLLFMPGANSRALEKSRDLPADGLIFDLEDAVAPDAKEAARANVAASVRRGGYGRRELVLRANALDSAWGEADLATAASLPLDAVLLPKVESAEHVRDTAAWLGAASDLAIWCMIETPRGVLAAAEIAAVPRVAALVMGTSDL